MSRLNTFTGRLLIAAVCVAAAKVAASSLERPTGRKAEPIDLATFPATIGDWVGVDTSVDERLNAHVGSLTEPVNRIYENAAGQTLSLHLASFPAELSMPHPPPLCYRNAGWTIIRESWRKNGADRGYSQMVADHDGEKAIVAYWYQLGQHAAGDRGGLRRAMQKLRWESKPRPPIVKVLIQSSGTPEDAEVTAAINQFSAAIYDWIRARS